MKKIFLFILFGILWSGTSVADEMVIHLKSGNAVVINYTGTIQDITLTGETDAIAGLSMPRSASGKAAEGQNSTITSVPAQKNKKSAKKTYRLKWADPKTED